VRAKYRRRLGSRARFRNPHAKRSNPRQHLTLGLKAISHHRRTPLFGSLAGKARQKLLEFGLHRLGDQPLRALLKHRRQKIPSRLWLAKFDYRILLHGGVTPCWLLKPISTIEFQQVTPPSSTHHRRTPDSVIAPRETSQFQPRG
jgi:hypothetical protein